MQAYASPPEKHHAGIPGTFLRGLWSCRPHQSLGHQRSFLPEPDPKEAAAPRETWPWIVPITRRLSHAQRSPGAEDSPSIRTQESWLPHCPLSPAGSSGRALAAATSSVQHRHHPPAQDLQLRTAGSPWATPCEGAPDTLTFGGEIQEHWELGNHIRGDGHPPAALHLACCWPSAQDKGCPPWLLNHSSSARCPVSEGRPVQACCLLTPLLATEGQRWGAPKQCPAGTRP